MYCAISDIQAVITDEELINLSDDEDTGAINTARVEAVIAQADSTIDVYIGVRYSVPLSQAPEAVKTISVSIALYRLYERSGLAIPEKRKNAYEYALSLLKDIARGTATLGIDEVKPIANAGSNKPANDRVFTRKNMRDL
ncbi:gp436 family protein [Candidatus Magnetominusculus xianensis]|uniref:DUF1320 domain-containing protein n=1 Tax=Candidatus Magnetominusculus xianensis TaxID=1748249 RepID=A0ABR5SCG4_9BACT|nr:DUF1320 domain-containing protein [Candidatus Magnetominusculus xianensis]KWT81145.1 hypothetical protein ASN18_2651 [Candidatus Magnetominusculus xianensis]MBF0402975.1 DUF1320 domain-containing protein [Nitrospirota bacterium]